MTTVETVAPQSDQPKPSLYQRRKALFITIGIILLIGFIWFLLWLFWFRLEEYTDDAYVGGNRVLLKSQVQGTVTAYFADDNDFVRQGDILVTLDTTDYALQLEYQKQNLALAVRQIGALKQTYAAQKSALHEREINLKLAEQEYENRQAVVSSLAISREEMQQSTSSYSASKAAYETQKAQAAATYASLGDGPIEEHPTITAQIEAVKIAYVNLHRCRIPAPATGFVAKRTTQVGDTATPATPLMSIVPLDQMWIEANYKETQLRKMKVGQPAEVTVDLYGRSVVFKGKVNGILAGTGSVFSLLPPQNATGNWIKIVQRLPVRIDLDPEQIEKFPLRLGLSVETTVDITVPGDPLRLPRPLQLIEKTNVYTVDMELIEKEINEILTNNLSFSSPNPLEKENDNPPKGN